MKIKSILMMFSIALMLSTGRLAAQVAINADGTIPDNSAMLDVKSTNRGLLPPRMTHAQMNTITEPANGLIIYCTDCSASGTGALAMHIDGAWYIFAPSCLVPLFPAEGAHVPGPTQIVWNWQPVADATGYKWNTINDYGSATDMLAVTTKTETGLACNTPYLRYVWSYNACGNSAATTLSSATILDPPDAPAEGTHVPSPTQIVWNWNTVAGATGYKWSTTNDYNTAAEMFGETTKTETGLTCVTPYTRFVWAYNICGVSVATTLTQTTSGTVVNPPTAGVHIPSLTEIVWKWNPVPGATGYKWSTSDDYDNAVDVGLNLLVVETGLTCNTNYTRYIWAYSECGNSSAAMTTQATSAIAVNAPAEGTHVPDVTQIVWNWNPVSGATGYKWSAVNDYATATEMGTATTKTETGLSCNSPYTRFVWAYGTCGNSTALTLAQTTLACPIIGPCPGIPTVSYEGKTYNTVQIGTQCWFKENLNAGIRVDGGVEQTDNSIIEKHCMNNLESNCDIYGALYQWNEMMQYATTEGSQGICPAGWHIPTEAEYATLITYLGGEMVAGGKMKEAGTTHWSSPNTGATNSSGFTSLPAGYYNVSWDYFFYFNYNNYLWSSTQSNLNDAWMRYLDYANEEVTHQSFAKVNSLSVRCLAESCTSAPSQPTSGTHEPTQTQVIWNWNTVTGATGYKWSAVNDFALATDMGTATTHTETGLACNTPYTRYVWAYNACGLSAVLTLNQTTTTCITWSCGDPFTISHVTGDVAPVDKTVTYGTVTNIPGETSKCWITRNLGASQQATAVDDATEASAGWYWQFNRKQGYQYISSRIPATTWISTINETSDWITANDPCTIELGSPWRIPTYTEWYNVDNTGGWTNWNGPWNSGLKLHAAGNLNYSEGSLNNRGSYGRYWSSTQDDATYGWSLYFYSSNSSMNNNNKAYGFALRCLSED